MKNYLIIVFLFISISFYSIDKFNKYIPKGDTTDINIGKTIKIWQKEHIIEGQHSSYVFKGKAIFL